MKKRFIVKWFFVFCASAVVVSACKQKAKVDHHDVGKVEIDSELKALLAPTNEQVVTKAKTTTATYGPKIFMTEMQGVVGYDSRGEQSIASRVSGRVERLYVKYNYQPVKKGELIMEIYAPDLAAAQQELIYLSQSAADAPMLAQAKQRLLLLGVSAKTIAQVLRTQKVSYKIPVYSTADGFVVEQGAVAAAPSLAMAPQTTGASGSMDGMGEVASSTTLAANVASQSAVLLREGQYVNAGQSLFTVYRAENVIASFAVKPQLANYIKVGEELALYTVNNKAETFRLAKVGLVQPIVKDGEPFNLIKVYLGKSSLKVGEVLTAKLPIAVTKSYWLPTTAVLANGNEYTVFKQEGNVFTSKPVAVGLQIEGLIQIKTNIEDWQVAVNAAYLVDSESFIKSK